MKMKVKTSAASSAKTSAIHRYSHLGERSSSLVTWNPDSMDRR
jgi:hypothetical protein